VSYVDITFVKDMILGAHPINVWYRKSMG